MSCPHEWQISAYVDAGLDAASARALETHLVGCARCRRRVLALRDESRVLRDLAHERLPAPVAPARAGRGVALGLPLAVGGLALASFVASALIESLPRPFHWFAPKANLGVTRMSVDLFFAIRDSFSAWFDFAFALAALGAFAGVAYLAADLLLRRTRRGGRGIATVLLLGAVAALAPRAAQAKVEVRQQDNVKVEAGETIEGSLIALGDTVTIEGTVRGDLVAFGDTVRIRGKVEGNVFCGGDEVELSATVAGSAHCAGHELRASGTTAGSLYAAGGDLTIEKEARVGADLAVGCGECRVAGDVARDLLAAGDSLELSGHAGRDVSIHGKDVSFRETASYPGAIDLHMPKGAQPDIATGSVLGKTTRLVLEGDGPASSIQRFTQLHRLRGHFVLVASAFLVGLVLFAIAPGMFATRVESAGRFFGALGAGLAACVSIIVGGVLCAVSIVGIPAAAIIFVALAMLLFIGPIVVAAVVGRAVMRSAASDFRGFAMALGVGHLLLGVLTVLPGIGGVALFILVLEGVGLLTLHAFDWWSERRAARQAAAELPA